MKNSLNNEKSKTNIMQNEKKNNEESFNTWNSKLFEKLRESLDKDFTFTKFSEKFYKIKK